MLIANAPSGLREQQLLICHLVEFFSFVREKDTDKISYKAFDPSFFNFRFIYLHNK